MNSVALCKAQVPTGAIPRFASGVLQSLATRSLRSSAKSAGTFLARNPRVSPMSLNDTGGWRIDLWLSSNLLPHPHVPIGLPARNLVSKYQMRLTGAQGCLSGLRGHSPNRRSCCDCRRCDARDRPGSPFVETPILGCTTSPTPHRKANPPRRLPLGDGDGTGIERDPANEVTACSPKSTHYGLHPPAVNHPGFAGDSVSWEGWGHVEQMWDYHSSSPALCQRPLPPSTAPTESLDPSTRAAGRPWRAGCCGTWRRSTAPLRYQHAGCSARSDDANLRTSTPTQNSPTCSMVPRISAAPVEGAHWVSPRP